ncbi:hypothetical protein LCGC14_0943230 [marine sediment metagenome]|uniref:Uncharacterized protein n=1 Tax=marine sediment metagenome TaxID=412755 RepID=A0A0F9NP46_9ZZZZ
MALFKELLGSRTGATRGTNATPENMIIRVLAEPEDFVTLENGTRIAPDPRGLVETQFIARGSIHGWDGSARATGYTVLEQKAPGHWTVRVDFTRDSATQPPTDEWLWNFRGASIVQTQFEQVVDETQTDITGPGHPDNPDVLVGPRLWVAKKPTDPPDPNPPTFFVNSYDENGVAQTIALVPAGGDGGIPPRKREGFQQEWPAMTGIATRTVTNFKETLVNRIVPFSKTVNSKKFIDAAPGFVKLTDYNIDLVAPEDVNSNPIGGGIRGTRRPTKLGKRYRVSLSFLFSSLRWTPIERVATFPDPKSGYEMIVRTNDGNAVVDQFSVANSKDFNNLLRILV